jgi:hypothetical protein
MLRRLRILGDAIFHVHAKDTQIYGRNLPVTGVLDTKSYTDEKHRSWIFRTLRMFGCLSRAASFLHGVVMKEKPAAAWWV